jgi:hypothetical protein
MSVFSYIKHFKYEPYKIWMLNKIIILILLSVVFSSQSLYSQKEEVIKDRQHPFFYNKFQFDAGAFIPTKIVKFSANGSTPNGMIDFSKNFDFNNNEITPQLGFKWLFSRKWQLYFEYFSINNSHKSKLEEDISFGDITFKKGSYVEGGYKINMLRIFVGRTFFESQKHQFGAGLGVHALRIGPYIEGEIHINEDETSFERINLKTNAPLPNIGIWYYFSPNAKWLISTKADWFGISLGDYSVKLWDISAGVNYQLFKNIGIFANYKFFKTEARVNKNNWNGKFSFKFNGPAIGLTANF